MNTAVIRHPRLPWLRLIAGLAWLASVAARGAEETWALELDTLRAKVNALASERQQQRAAADGLSKAHGDILTRLRRAHDEIAGRSGPGAVLKLLTDGAPDQAALGTIMEDALRRRDTLVAEAASIAAAAATETERMLALGDWPLCRPDLAEVNGHMEGLRDRLEVLARDLKDFRSCLGKIRVAQAGWPAIRTAALRVQTEVETIQAETETKAKACEELVRQVVFFDVERDSLLRRLDKTASAAAPEESGAAALDRILRKLPAYPSADALLQTGIRLREDRKEAASQAADLKRKLEKVSDLWRSAHGRLFEDGVQPVWREWKDAAVPMLEAVQRLLAACVAQQQRAVAQQVRIEETERRFRNVSTESSKLQAEAEAALRDVETRLAASAGDEQRRLQAEAQAERERLAGLQAVEAEAERGLQDSSQAAENAKRKAEGVEKTRGVLPASDSGANLLEFDMDAVQAPGH